MSDRSAKIIPFPGSEPPRSALVLRVELVMTPYPIWRRLRIAEQATFWDLHVAIQDAVGWSHRHRHLFTADDPGSGQRLRFGIPEVSLETLEEPEAAGAVPACLAGAGACPLEGCGGPERFGELLRLGDPLLPPDFAPDSFDPAAVVFGDPDQRWQEFFGDR
jgi:hypothetical protein